MAILRYMEEAYYALVDGVFADGWGTGFMMGLWAVGAFAPALFFWMGWWGLTPIIVGSLLGGHLNARSQRREWLHWRRAERWQATCGSYLEGTTSELKALLRKSVESTDKAVQDVAQLSEKVEGMAGRLDTELAVIYLSDIYDTLREINAHCREAHGNVDRCVNRMDYVMEDSYQTLVVWDRKKT